MRFEILKVVGMLRMGILKPIGEVLSILWAESGIAL